MALCSHFGTHLHVSLTDVHSLSCNLIIRSPTKAEPLWYEGQCSVDGIDFLSSNNVNKTMPLGNQEKMANATEVRICLTQWIERWEQKLRDKVSEIKVHTTKTSGKCGTEHRGRDGWQERRGRAHGGVGCECLCVKELSACGTVQAQGTQWIKRESRVEKILTPKLVEEDLILRGNECIRREE